MNDDSWRVVKWYEGVQVASSTLKEELAGWRNLPGKFGIHPGAQTSTYPVSCPDWNFQGNSYPGG